jgi:predicted HTH transcriptional regulator
MLFTKPLAEIDESDLQTLVDNGVREGKEIEYKEALTLFSPEQKQEFLNDVSSFANTNGGLLFYGIRESKDDAGVPLEVCGLKGENPGKRINDMETIIRTGLEPRLLGVTIWPVSLPSHEDRVVLILSIPKSFAAPHMVKSSGRFYSRNSTGKFQLDVTQIRAAFEFAGTTAERIRAFRTERLSPGASIWKDIPGEEERDF